MKRNLSGFPEEPEDSAESGSSEPPEREARIADLTLELPMRFFGRTVARTRRALETLQPGQVLALRTDDP